MRDPFAPKTKSRSLRDTSLSMAAVAALLGFFAYVSYQRMAANDNGVPDHVRMAPVAEMVWPDYRPPNPDLMTGGRQTSPQPHTAQIDHPTRRTAHQQPPRNRVAELSPRASGRADAGRLPADRSVERPAQQFEQPFIQRESSKTNTDHRSAPGRATISDPSVALAEFQQAAKEVNAAIAEIEVMTRRQTAAAKSLLRPTTPRQPSRAPQARPTPPSLVTMDVPGAQTRPRVGTSPKINLATNKTRDSNSFAPTRPPGRPTEAPIKTPILTPIKGSPKSYAKPSLKRPKAKLDHALMPADRPTPASLRVSPSRPVIVAAVPAQQVASHGHRSPAGQLPIPPTLPRDIARVATAASTTQIRNAGRTSTPDRNAATQKATDVAATELAVPADAYIVQPGDSFWSIATKQYGDGRLFRALYQSNRATTEAFESPAAGVRLNLPTQDQLTRQWPELCPQDLIRPRHTERNEHGLVGYDQDPGERLYTTRDGDTLFQIAAQKLGQASRYVEIMTANDVRLPAKVNHLSPLNAGLKLILPEP